MRGARLLPHCGDHPLFRGMDGSGWILLPRDWRGGFTPGRFDALKLKIWVKSMRCIDGNWTEINWINVTMPWYFCEFSITLQFRAFRQKTLSSSVALDQIVGSGPCILHILGWRLQSYSKRHVSCIARFALDPRTWHNTIRALVEQLRWREDGEPVRPKRWWFRGEKHLQT